MVSSGAHGLLSVTGQELLCKFVGITLVLLTPFLSCSTLGCLGADAVNIARFLEMIWKLWATTRSLCSWLPLWPKLDKTNDIEVEVVCSVIMSYQVILNPLLLAHSHFPARWDHSRVELRVCQAPLFKSYLKNANSQFTLGECGICSFCAYISNIRRECLYFYCPALSPKLRKKILYIDS